MQQSGIETLRDEFERLLKIPVSTDEMTRWIRQVAAGHTSTFDVKQYGEAYWLTPAGILWMVTLKDFEKTPKVCQLQVAYRSALQELKLVQ